MLRLLATWLQLCVVCLTCRPDDVYDHHLLISSMSASRSVQLLETDFLLWLVLDYGTKNSCLDSHVPVFCFSFYRAMHFSAKCGIAIACHLSVHLSVCLSVCNVGGL